MKSGEEVSPLPVRTTREIIDKAIGENRLGEYLLYSLALAFVIGGMGILISSLIVGREVPGIIGGVTTSLFYPAMRLAKRMREQNMAIRLLEISLNDADTSLEAALLLHQFFQSTFREEHTHTGPIAESKAKSAPKKPRADAKGASDVP